MIHLTDLQDWFAHLVSRHYNDKLLSRGPLCLHKVSLHPELLSCSSSSFRFIAFILSILARKLVFSVFGDVSNLVLLRVQFEHLHIIVINESRT